MENIPKQKFQFGQFVFVRWYVEKEVSLDSTEEEDILVGWGCKGSIMDLQ